MKFSYHDNIPVSKIHAPHPPLAPDVVSCIIIKSIKVLL